MKITNRYGLPSAIVRAIENDPYTPGEKSDISVTQLIAPPQQVALKRKHRDEMTEDASDMIWSLLGQAVHSVLERAEDDLGSVMVEQRMYADVEGWKLSGQFDRYDLKSSVIQDYKITSAWSVCGKPKPEWIAQLNVLRWLAHVHLGHHPETLQIVAILRDHKPSEAAKGGDYPRVPVAVIDIPVWPLDDTEAYIRERIRLHKLARAGEFPPCTPDERWNTGDRFAVMGKAKRAIKVHDTEAEALAMVESLGDGHRIEPRPGRNTRCESYCAVRDFCNQYAAMRNVE